MGLLSFPVSTVLVAENVVVTVSGIYEWTITENRCGVAKGRVHGGSGRSNVVV